MAGLIQPDSGIWGLADLQMQLAAAFVRASDAGSPKAEWFRRAKAEGSDNLGHGIGYIDSPRHAIEVEHYTYRRRLQQLLARLA